MLPIEGRALKQSNLRYGAYLMNDEEPKTEKKGSAIRRPSVRQSRSAKKSGCLKVPSERRLHDRAVSGASKHGFETSKNRKSLLFDCRHHRSCTSRRQSDSHDGLH